MLGWRDGLVDGDISSWFGDGGIARHPDEGAGDWEAALAPSGGPGSFASTMGAGHSIGSPGRGLTPGPLVTTLDDPPRPRGPMITTLDDAGPPGPVSRDLARPRPRGPMITTLDDAGPPGPVSRDLARPRPRGPMITTLDDAGPPGPVSRDLARPRPRGPMIEELGDLDENRFRGPR